MNGEETQTENFCSVVKEEPQASSTMFMAVKTEDMSNLNGIDLTLEDEMIDVPVEPAEHLSIKTEPHIEMPPPPRRNPSRAVKNKAPLIKNETIKRKRAEDDIGILEEPAKKKVLIDLSTSKDNTWSLPSIPIKRSADASAHIIFLIDNSGSMRKTDVIGYRFNQRSKVVFDCCAQFVEQQLKQTGTSSDSYSVVIFAEEKQVLLSKEPLTTELPQKIRNLNVFPRLGTLYKVAIAALKRITRNDSSDFISAILLSDGRPGDKGAELKLRALVKKKPTLHLHTLGVGTEDDFSMLKLFASIGNGSFLHSGFNYADISVNFSQLSSTLTTTRTTIAPGTERALKTLLIEKSRCWKRNSGWKSYEAARFEWVGDTFKKIDEPERTVRLREKPFAKGGERYAFHMMDDSSDTIHFVVKESIYVEHYRERLGFHKNSFRSQAIATKMAEEFNSRQLSVPPITFIPYWIYRLRDNSVPGNFRYFSAEKFLEGEYTKFNSNNGYVCESISTNTNYRNNVKNTSRKINKNKNKYKYKNKNKNKNNKENEIQIKQEPSNNNTNTHQNTANVIQIKQEPSNNNTNTSTPQNTENVIQIKQEPSNNNTPQNTENEIQIKQEPSNNTHQNTEKLILPVANTNTNTNTETRQNTEIFKYQVPQAFSHFTYQVSNKAVLVCDIQGVGFDYTDPLVHSINREYGRADLGCDGFASFIRTHQCNDVCTMLDLDVLVRK